jgi:hypothetical protein
MDDLQARTLLASETVKATSSLFQLVAVALVLGVSGCGQAPSPNPDETGIGGQNLVISPGVTVSSGTYTIVGPNNFTSAGVVSIGNSADISITVSGLPIARGYTMYVWATASDGVTICGASATFNVVGSPTTVPVHLVCGIPTGTAQVTGSFNVCPVVDSLDALPSEVRVGGTVALSARAHDTDNGPSALSFKWKTNGAPLPNHPQQTLTFTCSTAGSVAISVTASDGDPDPSCADSLLATVTCTAP